jgi:hypothetical protein
MDKLHQVANRLIAEETMEAPEFEGIMSGTAVAAADTEANAAPGAAPDESDK